MPITNRDRDTIISSEGNLILDVPNGKIIIEDTFFDDLRFPAAGINPPGAASDPARDTTDGRLVFSASAVNIIAIQAQMPHNWKQGSTIHPHIHWSPTSTHTGNVLWEVKYKIANVNGVFPGSWTTLTSLDAGAGVADTHQIAGDMDITMTGKKFSCMLLMLVSRLGDDETDTYTGTAKLNEVDIHYEVQGFGTREEYSD